MGAGLVLGERGRTRRLGATHQARGDLARATAADWLHPGQGPDLFEQRRGFGLRKAGQHGGELAAGLGRHCLTGARQFGGEQARTPGDALQPRGERFRQPKGFDKGGEQGHVAEPQGQVRTAARHRRAPGQVRDLAVDGQRHAQRRPDHLDAELDELLRAIRAGRGAKSRAFVDIAAGDHAAFDVLPGHGDGEVGAQALFHPALGLDHEQPRAHGLAGQVEQQVQRLQHGGVDRFGAGGRQGGADRVERVGRNRRLDPHGRASTILRIAATRSARGTVNWPGRSARQAALSLTPDASSRPRSRSLMVTVPGGELVAADDHRGGREAAVGVFHLRPHAGGPEVDLGGDARGAQFAGDREIVAHPLLVEDQHHTGPRTSAARSRPAAFSAAASRVTPKEKPVAGVRSPVNRATRSS